MSSSTRAINISLFSGKPLPSPIPEIAYAAGASSTNGSAIASEPRLRPAIEPRARMVALPVGPARVPHGTLQYSIAISITYADQYLA
jgi:hypothetical protein